MLRKRHTASISSLGPGYKSKTREPLAPPKQVGGASGSLFAYLLERTT